MKFDYANPYRSTRIPVFAREGAIVPLEVKSEITGFGSAATADALTLLVYPAEAPSSSTVRP